MGNKVLPFPGNRVCRELQTAMGEIRVELDSSTCTPILLQICYLHRRLYPQQFFSLEAIRSLTAIHTAKADQASPTSHSISHSPG